MSRLYPGELDPDHIITSDRTHASSVAAVQIGSMGGSVFVLQRHGNHMLVYYSADPMCSENLFSNYRYY
jgi:hypothetical protein